MTGESLHAFGTGATFSKCLCSVLSGIHRRRPWVQGPSVFVICILAKEMQESLSSEVIGGLVMSAKKRELGSRVLRSSSGAPTGWA